MKTLLVTLALSGLACTLSTPGADPGAAARGAGANGAQEQRAVAPPTEPGRTPGVAQEEDAQHPDVAVSAQDYAELRKEAEARFTEGSYELAHRVYERAAALELTRDDRRWVEFRLADTQWRSAAATNDPDSSRIDSATRELERIVGAAQRPEARARMGRKSSAPRRA